MRVKPLILIEVVFSYSVFFSGISLYQSATRPTRNSAGRQAVCDDSRLLDIGSTTSNRRFGPGREAGAKVIIKL